MNVGGLCIDRTVRDRGPTVVTAGSFDGFHRGHRRLIATAREYANAHGLPLTLLTFEPLPREFLLPEEAPARLTTFGEKILESQSAGIDRIVCLRFDKHLAQTRADDFIEAILLRGLQAKGIVVGQNFRFGYRREGDLERLERSLSANGRELIAADLETMDTERISSTRIRTALAAGDLVQATELLGHPYRMTGRVQHGHQRGRLMGYPTANLAVRRRRCPVGGVYAVRVYGVGPLPYNGVASLGIRPGLDDRGELLEVHLFDCSTDLYGRRLAVEFIAFLRPEQRFGSWSALQNAIDHDAVQARRILDQRGAL
jgi:riboflavin kinase/FMN adenylyltransferase